MPRYYNRMPMAQGIIDEALVALRRLGGQEGAEFTSPVFAKRMISDVRGQVNTRLSRLSGKGADRELSVIRGEMIGLRLGDARMERGTLKYRKTYKFGHRRALSKHYQQPVPKMGKI